MLDAGKVVRVGRTEVDVAGERTQVPELVGVSQPDLLLVNDDDLTYGKIRLDERSMATVVERIADIDDRLARALCWSAAWDMTRDGEMAARDYVALALRGVAGESEIGVVQSIQGRLRGALDRFADPAWAPDGWTQLANTGRRRHARRGSRLRSPARVDTHLRLSRENAGAHRGGARHSRRDRAAARAGSRHRAALVAAVGAGGGRRRV